MNLLFCLFHYFPHGGLQKKCINLAKLSAARGHTVTILAGDWQGPRPDGIKIELLKVSAWTNTAWVKKFIAEAQHYIHHHQFDLVMGFNRMPGLDVYYGSDPCYKQLYQSLPWYKKIQPHYSDYLKIEQQMFAHKNMVVFALTPQEKNHFATHYRLKKENLHLIPLHVDGENYSLAPYQLQTQNRLKQEYKISTGQQLILFIGSSFKTKGLYRALKAIASLPPAMQKNITFWIVGDDNPKPYQRLAKTLQCKLAFLGGRDDIPTLLQAADLLLHPALLENGGNVLLEAMASGLPILTTDICGYAPYVVQAQCGKVVATPFVQEKLNQLLLALLTEDLTLMRERGIQFCREQQVTEKKEFVIQVLEELDPHPVRLL